MQPYQQPVRRSPITGDPDSAIVKDLFSGKHIILLSCLDCIPLQGEGMMRQTRFQQSLEANAARLLEIDLDNEGDDHFQLNRSASITGVDIRKAFSNEVRELVSTGNWDLLLLNDVLPYVENPIYFLKQLKLVYAPYLKEIVVRLSDFDEISRIDKMDNIHQFHYQLSNQLYCFDQQALQRVLKVSGYLPTAAYPTSGNASHRSGKGINQLLGSLAFPNFGKNHAAFFCRASF